MLLPDNIDPRNSIYFNGAIVLSVLQEQVNKSLIDLFQEVRNHQEMSFGIFILSLDWLYLIDVAVLNQEGLVELCT
jgi:hypothetical protein